MSFQSYPSPESGLAAAPQPGIIPLRPLSISEILSAAVTVVRKHFVALGSLALGFAALSSAALIAVLVASGDWSRYVNGELLAGLEEAVKAGKTPELPVAFMVGLLLSVIISMVGSVLTSGFATVYTAQDAIGHPSPFALIRSRVVGRFWTLLALALVVGVCVALGLVALIVPGVLIYLAWAVCAPVAVMEKTGLSQSLKRSATLTKGFRPRVLGITLVALLISALIGNVVDSIVGSVATSSMSAVVIGDIVAIVLASITQSWFAAVIALIYVDLRLRKENLGAALAAAAGQPA